MEIAGINIAVANTTGFPNHHSEGPHLDHQLGHQHPDHLAHRLDLKQPPPRGRLPDQQHGLLPQDLLRDLPLPHVPDQADQADHAILALRKVQEDALVKI